MNSELTNTENGIIATIENTSNPMQVVAIKYLPDEQAFVTSGIQRYFGEREILMPAHLMVVDFQLMGAIVSTILENLSRAHDMEQPFEYAPKFEVLGTKYTLNRHGDYMRLLAEDEKEPPLFSQQ